jgi:hypothetical protein
MLSHSAPKDPKVASAMNEYHTRSVRDARNTTINTNTTTTNNTTAPNTNTANTK